MLLNSIYSCMTGINVSIQFAERWARKKATLNFLIKISALKTDDIFYGVAAVLEHQLHICPLNFFWDESTQNLLSACQFPSLILYQLQSSIYLSIPLARMTEVLEQNWESSHGLLKLSPLCHLRLFTCPSLRLFKFYSRITKKAQQKCPRSSTVFILFFNISNLKIMSQ